MTLDEKLRRTFESLGDRVREETERLLAGLTTELREQIETDRAAAAAQAAAEAKNAAEQEALAHLNAVVSAAEARGREAAARAAAAACEAGRAEGRQEGQEQGRHEGLEQGRREGVEQGRHEGLEQGRQEARDEGRQAGLEEGRKSGWESGLEEGKHQGRQEGKQEGLTEGLKQGRQEGRAEGLEVGKEEGRAEGREEGRREGQEEGRKAGEESAEAIREAARAEFKIAELAANDRLVDAIRAIDNARSLTEVLDALASSAGREAARVAVLLVRNGQLRGWRFIGFGSALDDRHDLEVAADDAGVIAEAARSGAAVSADSAVNLSVPSFAELPPGRDLLAVPVQMSGQVIAVLYADQGDHETGASLAWPSTLELLARHAARCLEAITAFRAAQVLTERPEIPSAKTDQDSSPARSAPRAEAADQVDAEQAARRYARLLVSEIKLYHESAVIAGRRERDLATRLGGEIARARVLYKQRVPGDAPTGTDYFLEELVRTLAGGDASLLEVRS